MNSKRNKKPKKQPAATIRTSNSMALRIAPHELKVGESTGSAGVTKQIAVQQTWQGPIPSPKQLAEFEAIKPGLADRIVSMAEDEGVHSRLIERRSLNWSIVAQLVGQAFGLGIAIACLYASYLLAMANHDAVAGILGGTTLTTVALAFLRWKKAPKAP
ncbi:MAG: DUF2335 domain-containing protein [Stenotrophomonas sp.]